MTNSVIIMPALLTIALGLLVTAACRNSEFKYLEKILYVLFWVSFFHTIYRFSIGTVGVCFYLAAFVLLSLVFAIVFRKNLVFKTINLTVALFPLYVIAVEVGLADEYLTMLGALLVLLLIMGYTRGMLKGASSKVVNIIEVVALSIWFLGLIFEANALQGIVLGIVAILFVLLGYRSDNTWSFYYTGIVATVLNLWQQLKDIWSKIPFWAYMLFAGLLLVGFVTYQEYSGKKKEENIEVPVKKEKGEVAVVSISSEQIISGTIIYLVIFLSVAEMVFHL